MSSSLSFVHPAQFCHLIRSYECGRCGECRYECQTNSCPEKFHKYYVPSMIDKQPENILPHQHWRLCTRCRRDMPPSSSSPSRPAVAFRDIKRR